MTTIKSWHLIAYDIIEPQRYRKIYRCLRGYGKPIQYSIFTCHLSPRQREELRAELEKLKADEDRLLIIKLCARCAHGIIEEGPDSHFEPEPPSFEIL